MDIQEIAQAIRELINSSPRTPTQDQLVALLNARMLIHVPDMGGSPGYSIHDCDERRNAVRIPQSGPKKPIYVSTSTSYNPHLPHHKNKILGSWDYERLNCYYCRQEVSREVALNSYIDWIKQCYGISSLNKWEGP